jgi:hypothetical protein
MDLLPIENQIYEIRGYKVMLDFDLAQLYRTETKRLKEQVRRNIGRFPEDFMFELTREEYNSLKLRFAALENEKELQPSVDGQSLRSQFATSKRGGNRYMPFAFTEQGVAMLSSVLNSETAITTNIKIMRAFVAVRQFAISTPVSEMQEWQIEMQELKQYIEDVFADYNDINEDTRLQFEQINIAIAEMQVRNRLSDKPRRRIGFHTEEQIKNNKNIIE